MERKNSKHIVINESNISNEEIAANDLIFIPANKGYNVGIINAVNGQEISYVIGDINNRVCINTININLIPENTQIFSLDKGDDYYYEYLHFLHTQLNLPYNSAIGVMANLYAESNFMPHAIGDGGTSYGLCQWHNERWERLVDFCNESGYDWQTAEGQLYFLKHELENRGSYLYNYLLHCDDAREAAYEFCVQFEHPADEEIAGYKRADMASRMLIPTIC